ncbi:MAG: class I SAM-dependent methyltransferase [Casimicrobiaceae bacterium]
MTAPPGITRREWEAALEPLLGVADGGLWRAHCDALNARLFLRWLGDARHERLLKTDLYDEAVGEGMFGLLAGRAACVVGIDLAANVAAAARERHATLSAVHADVRRLPFVDGAFEAVVSNSTLDHFATHHEIECALADLHRVLAPHGTLLLTLDNLANPAVALRNALPLAWLRRTGIVPYPVGATYRPGALRRVLGRLGFDVVDMSTLMHCPRLPAVARATRLQRHGSALAASRFLQRLDRWEWLGRLPTRFFTGYFVAVLARKR